MDHLVTEVESACAALGTNDGTTYRKDEDCLECVKDLIRFLRRDDANHTLRRTMGHIGVVRSDLLPILRGSETDPELFDMVLRLLVNLTSPELLLFREELPEEKTARNYYMQLQRYRQAYKEAFVDQLLWKVLAESLSGLLRKTFEDRSDDDRLMIERILILVRNILQVPRDSNSDKRTEDETTVHDQVLWVLHKSGMEDLMLFLASSDDEAQYCLHVLEIISLMFREQNPKTLASANFQRSAEERQEDEKELEKLKMAEEEKRKQRFHAVKSSRHSRFGGVFTLTNLKSISELPMIYHKPLTTVTNINFDEAKRPKKIAKNRLTPADDIGCSGGGGRRSALAIRLFLKEFCLEFLNGAYNKLMYIVKDNLNRQRAQQNDETYYLWALRFFMEFNRNADRYRVELVTETLSKSTFHYVQQQIDAYKDHYDHEKKNRPMCLAWARRMHLGLRAYQELLMNLIAMSQSPDEGVKRAGHILRADVFYEPEYRELCLQQIGIYQREKMSMGYLKDLVETTHVFLKLMESMSKSGHLMVSKKVKKRKGAAGGRRAGKSNNNPTTTSQLNSREFKEEQWEKVSTEAAGFLGGRGNLPTNVSPFDAASEIPIDDQKLLAMIRIQDLLRREKAADAVALLRAARDVWPENDVFAAPDADPEDEFMTLREIFFSDIPRPASMDKAAKIGPEEEAENDLNNGNEDDAVQGDAVTEEPEEYEDDEEDVEEIVTYSLEQEFEFKSFEGRFAVKSVCSAYAILFANYKTNSDFTNHCIVKMFHRVAWDCGLPALLFHASIFRVLHQVHKDLALLPRGAGVLKEIDRFGRFLLGRFFDTCLVNRKVFLELCFWKNAKEASEIVEGYGTQSSSNARQKASFWREDEEETLVRVFGQLKEMRSKLSAEELRAEEGDLLDSLTIHFAETKKSRRQVAKKLKQLGLIHDVKEVTRKPLSLKTPRLWGEEEMDQLKALYEEFKDAMDPIGRIRERMKIQRPKKRVLEKIFEMGLCDDRKKLMKKSHRRNLQEGDPGYLKSASESDSALDDSSSGAEESSNSSEDSSGKSDVDGLEPSSISSAAKLVQLLSTLCNDEEAKQALIWLKETFDEEANDREDDEDEDAEDVPLLATTEACIKALDDPNFQDLLEMLQMKRPSNEQQFWRIPADLKPRALKAKSGLLQKAVEGEVLSAEMLKPEVLLLTGQAQSGSKSPSETRDKAKKKHRKRGPNKWMPMRRGLDPEAMSRIGVSEVSSTPKSARKGKKGKVLNKSASGSSGKSRVAGRLSRLKAFDQESSDDNDDDNQAEGLDQDPDGSRQRSSGKDTSEDSETSQNRPSRKKTAAASFLDSSDEDEDRDEKDEDGPAAGKDNSKGSGGEDLPEVLPATVSKGDLRKYQKKIVAALESSDNDSEDDLLLSRRVAAAIKRSNVMGEKTGKGSSNSSSSSDEGVNDPMPIRSDIPDVSQGAADKDSVANRNDSIVSMLSSRRSRRSSGRSSSYRSSSSRSSRSSSPVRYVTLTPSKISLASTPDSGRKSPAAASAAKRSQNLTMTTMASADGPGSKTSPRSLKRPKLGGHLLDTSDSGEDDNDGGPAAGIDKSKGNGGEDLPEVLPATVSKGDLRKYQKKIVKALESSDDDSEDDLLLSRRVAAAIKRSNVMGEKTGKGSSNSSSLSDEGVNDPMPIRSDIPDVSQGAADKDSVANRNDSIVSMLSSRRSRRSSGRSSSYRSSSSRSSRSSSPVRYVTLTPSKISLASTPDSRRKSPASASAAKRSRNLATPTIASVDGPESKILPRPLKRPKMGGHLLDTSDSGEEDNDNMAPQVVVSKSGGGSSVGRKRMVLSSDSE